MMWQVFIVRTRRQRTAQADGTFIISTHAEHRLWGEYGDKERAERICESLNRQYKKGRTRFIVRRSPGGTETPQTESGTSEGSRTR